MSEIPADKESHFAKWERVIKATKFAPKSVPITISLQEHVARAIAKHQCRDASSCIPRNRTTRGNPCECLTFARAAIAAVHEHEGTNSMEDLAAKLLAADLVAAGESEFAPDPAEAMRAECDDLSPQFEREAERLFDCAHNNMGWKPIAESLRKAYEAGRALKANGEGR